MKPSTRSLLIIAGIAALCIVATALLRELLIALDVVTLPYAVIGGAGGGGAFAGIAIVARIRRDDRPKEPPG